MATITTWQDGDDGSTVQDLVNANFTNLDNDKIEADTSDTLTNKTINVDNNTVSNIETDNFKSTAKTGSDTKVATGTAGSTDNLVKWNADGDVVDASVAVSTDDTLGGASASDAKLPTEQAVKDYVDDNTGRKIFLSAENGNGGTLAARGYQLTATSNNVWFRFVLPSSFDAASATFKLYLDSYYAGNATHTITTTVNIGADGETYNNHTDSDTYTTGTLAQGEVEVLDISTSFTPAAANDVCDLSINYDSNTGGVGMYIKGLLIEW